MPIHDWTRVDAGIFHHFHHGWIEEIARALNRGLLPPDHYALAEQIAGGLGPDVLTLQRPTNGPPPHPGTPRRYLPGDGPAPSPVSAPGRADLRGQGEGGGSPSHQQPPGHRHRGDRLAGQQKQSARPSCIRGEDPRDAPRRYPPTRHRPVFAEFARNPQGIHKAIWDEFIDNEFALPRSPAHSRRLRHGPCPRGICRAHVGRALSFPTCPCSSRRTFTFSCPRRPPTNRPGTASRRSGAACCKARRRGEARRSPHGSRLVFAGGKDGEDQLFRHVGRRRVLTAAGHLLDAQPSARKSGDRCCSRGIRPGVPRIRHAVLPAARRTGRPSGTRSFPGRSAASTPISAELGLQQCSQGLAGPMQTSLDRPSCSPNTRTVSSVSSSSMSRNSSTTR